MGNDRVTNPTVNDIAADVASKLVTTRCADDAVWFTTPLMYPSGSHVCACVRLEGDAYVVSDDGGAATEAFPNATDEDFSAVAIDVAAQYGIAFDRMALVAAGVERDCVHGAVVLVANASQSAATTALRLASTAMTAALDSPG